MFSIVAMVSGFRIMKPPSWSKRNGEDRVRDSAGSAAGHHRPVRRGSRPGQRRPERRGSRREHRRPVRRGSWRGHRADGGEDDGGYGAPLGSSAHRGERRSASSTSSS
ncbi:unnamed protein product [Linum trigynum]|uniref:Uncharacterized protein n=1 Tax=Linum trigynum TaxID=586398 RepID=A0AAV2C8M1_9ROSI